MSDEFEPGALDDRLRELFDALPRESGPEAGELDKLVRHLEAEDLLAQRGQRVWWPAQVAAGLLLMLLGGFAGARIATRNSLEVQLERSDLSLADRILLMQRAGSAYVRAANAYAGAAAQTDSTAVEVASRVLLGAAQAVARSKLDGGLTPDLTAALRSTAGQPANVSRQRVIWF